MYDGGAPIIGYSLDMRLKSEADPEKPTEGWKRIDTHGPLVLTEFSIGQLDEKQEYEFKVSARNQVGWGRHAYLKEAVSPKEILGKNEPLLQSTVAAVSLSKSKILEKGSSKCEDHSNDINVNVFLWQQRLQRSTWMPV